MSEVRDTTLAQPSKLSAYITLPKPDVSLLVLMTTGAGYYMGARGPIGWLHMIHVIVATMMIAAGTASLNHYIERESDRYMRRTASRPLPTGVLTPTEALRFGIVLSLPGPLDLYLTAGFWPCFLGVFTCLSFLLPYPPLKKPTPQPPSTHPIPSPTPPPTS